MAMQKAPLVKHRRNTFGFEPSYERRWESVVELQAIQQKTPHRYQQSPVFKRKMTNNYKPQNSLEFLVIDTSLGKFFGNPEHPSLSSGDEASSSADKVHLLSNPPWKSSGSPDQDEDPVVDQTTQRQKLCHFSPTFSRRLNSKLELEAEYLSQRSGESPRTSPIFKRTRRGNKKRRSTCSPTFSNEHNDASTDMPGSLDQDNLEDKENETLLIPGSLHLEDRNSERKLLSQEENNLENFGNDSIIITNPNYIAADVPTTSPNRLVINVTTFVDSDLHPDDPETPLADSDTHVFVTLSGDDSLPPPPSPLTLRRFLDLEDSLETEAGLSEEDLLKSRILTRRCSSSSDSSTSTLI